MTVQLVSVRFIEMDYWKSAQNFAHRVNVSATEAHIILDVNVTDMTLLIIFLHSQTHTLILT